MPDEHPASYPEHQDGRSRQFTDGSPTPPVIDPELVIYVQRQIDHVSRTTGGENPNSFGLWKRAWEDAMAACGYLRANLYAVPKHIHDVDGTRINTVDYGWEADCDEYIAAWLTGDHYHPSNHSWSMAHSCFMWVDRFRPNYVLPSAMLAEMLADAENLGAN